MVIWVYCCHFSRRPIRICAYRFFGVCLSWRNSWIGRYCFNGRLFNHWTFFSNIIFLYINFCFIYFNMNSWIWKTNNTNFIVIIYLIENNLLGPYLILQTANHYNYCTKNRYKYIFALQIVLTRYTNKVDSYSAII